MIPRIIHYIWVGPKAFPDEAQRLVDEWQDIMPDWRIMRWTEDTIDLHPRFIRQAHGVRAYNRVANYARLAALRAHGGFYFDHDIKLIRSIEPLLEMPGVVGFQTDRNDYALVNNAFIGGSAGPSIHLPCTEPARQHGRQLRLGHGDRPGLAQHPAARE